MRTIHKYKLNHFGETTLEVPWGAHPLSVQVQDHNNNIYLWMYLNTEGVLKTRRFRVYATGDDLEVHSGEYLDFIGTVHVTAGMELVFHVFELISYNQDQLE